MKIHRKSKIPSEAKVESKERTMNAIAENRLIGTKDFRRNLSGCLNQVIYKKKMFLIGNSFHPTETATVISTDALKSLISHFTFQSTITYDEATKQYVAAVEQFNTDGVGDTAEEAMEMVLDNVETAIESFFEKVDAFLQFKKYADLYPYYLKARLTNSREQLAQILGFK